MPKYAMTVKRKPRPPDMFTPESMRHTLLIHSDASYGSSTGLGYLIRYLDWSFYRAYLGKVVYSHSSFYAEANAAYEAIKAGAFLLSDEHRFMILFVDNKRLAEILRRPGLVREHEEHVLRHDNLWFNLVNITGRFRDRLSCFYRPRYLNSPADYLAVISRAALKRVFPIGTVFEVLSIEETNLHFKSLILADQEDHINFYITAEESRTGELKVGGKKKEQNVGFDFITQEGWIKNKSAAQPTLFQQIVAANQKPFMQYRPIEERNVGDNCQISANFFKANLEQRCIFVYEVVINPVVKSRGIKQPLWDKLMEMYPRFHIDLVANDELYRLYTTRLLPFPEKEFSLKLKIDGIEEKVYKIKIKIAHWEETLGGDIPQERLQQVSGIFDIILRQLPRYKFSVINRLQLGTAYFSPQFGTANIGDGLQCCRGYYQRFRPTQTGMSLNIDVTMSVFYKPIGIIDIVRKILKMGKNPNRTFSDSDIEKLNEALGGLTALFQRQKFRINQITLLEVNQLSVEQELKNQIALSGVNCLAIQAGSASQPLYLPLENCRIFNGQRYLKKNFKPEQVVKILKNSHQHPKERMNTISRVLSQVDHGTDKFARNFGVIVETTLALIPDARVLPPPMLKYNGQTPDNLVKPRVGRWSMGEKKFFSRARINRWTCLNFSSRVTLQNANNFVGRLLQICINNGMVISPVPLLPFTSESHHDMRNSLVKLNDKALSTLDISGKHGRLQLLIIILPDDSRDFYGVIKKICETELGIISQCCQSHVVLNPRRQYLEGMSQKLNVKAGGQNAVLDETVHSGLQFFAEHPTIVFGADVSHPRMDDDSTPSIAAVVATINWPSMSEYRTRVSAQTCRNEIIENLYKVGQHPEMGEIHSGMIRELLLCFYQATGCKPHRILFYRDGVGEGQFQQLLNHEVGAISKACASLEETYAPPVTFVVVQKRHRTRLFPADYKNLNSADKSGNILPGTVVDSVICNPIGFDFYLCSHAVNQGTSRPIHYHVLRNDNRFSTDYLQTLTNSLCYTYARCTHSVSIVAPVYYAHLAAVRARHYVADESGGTSAATALPEIHENIKDLMFYC